MKIAEASSECHGTVGAGSFTPVRDSAGSGRHPAASGAAPKERSAAKRATSAERSPPSDQPARCHTPRIEGYATHQQTAGRHVSSGSQSDSVPNSCANRLELSSLPGRGHARPAGVGLFCRKLPTRLAKKSQRFRKPTISLIRGNVGSWRSPPSIFLKRPCVVFSSGFRLYFN